MDSNRNGKKIILKILILTLMFQFCILINTSQAAFWDDIFSYGDSFLETGKQGAKTNNSMSDDSVRAIMNDLYSILFPLGIVITVIVGGILGIKFMMASAEDKAKVKESMVPYVVGCIAIYGAFGIWRIVIEILSAIV